MRADEVGGMIGRNAPVVLVDTRTEYEYRLGHLPGAISVPPYRFSDLDTLLPPDKEIEIVFYCRGFG